MVSPGEYVHGFRNLCSQTLIHSSSSVYSSYARFGSALHIILVFVTNYWFTSYQIQFLPWSRFWKQSWKHVRGVNCTRRCYITETHKHLSKTLAAGHRRTPKHLAPTICEYCVSIFAFRMQKQKQKQKEKQAEAEGRFTAQITATFVEAKAQSRASADKKMLR